MPSEFLEVPIGIQEIQNSSVKAKDQVDAISQSIDDVNEIFLNVTQKKIHEGLVFNAIRANIDNRDPSSFNLAVVILQHILWVLKVRAVLDKRLSIDVKEIGDHTKCDLGRWMLGEGSLKFRESPVFRRLSMDHETLHKSVYSILSATGTKTQTHLENEYSELLALSKSVVASLTAMDEQT